MTATSRAGLELSVEQVRRRCDPAAFTFTTTAELQPSVEMLGQERAVAGLTLGLAMPGAGFNVYVAGPPGTGKQTAADAFLHRAAQARAVPSDWCYIHNFHEPDRPRALRLAPGQGRRLRDGVSAVLQSARREIPRAFESEEYIARREAVITELNHRREQEQGALVARAQSAGFLLQPTPMGIVLVPVMGNRPLSDEDLAALRPEMREEIQQRRAGLEGEVSAFLKAMRAVDRETREKLDAQDREVALHVIGGVVDDLAEDYEDQPEVSAFIQQIREGILGDIALFRTHPLQPDGSPPPNPEPAAGDELHARAFRKYEVNVVIDNGDATGAPVVIETNPTYPNLIGRIEREALFGALMTDFTLIVPGALHRANGGYLLLRVDDLLRAPIAWDALKRALRAGALTIEDVGEALGLGSARGLRPDPIPLDVKVFLLGGPMEYQLLYALDADFRELFKVRAEFATEMERTAEAELQLASFIGAWATSNTRPLDRTAVARVIEESSRIASDQRKLSLHVSELLDIVREADYWAAEERAPAIGGAHVARAVEQRAYRSAQLAERLQETTARGVLLIRPEGAAIGEVHGLSVLDMGDTVFGRPVRITASAGPGQDGVLDIERQVELGGPIHSKGVLILAGYLRDTYARDLPLALTARLVFEQSYQGIEGDSASLAELLALLSRLAELPLRRDLAVTGSVNQRGEVQAVGGVNEKVEGFFDTCAATGLSGGQGVILPAANVQHLMLRDDVVAAVAAGRFHVYGIHSVDEAIELLSGVPAGARGADGRFPDGGVHARVEARLHELAEALRGFNAPRTQSRNGRSRRNGVRGGAEHGSPV